MSDKKTLAELQEMYAKKGDKLEITVTAKDDLPRGKYYGHKKSIVDGMPKPIKVAWEQVKKSALSAFRKWDSKFAHLEVLIDYLEGLT